MSVWFYLFLITSLFMLYVVWRSSRPKMTIIPCENLSDYAKLFMKLGENQKDILVLYDEKAKRFNFYGIPKGWDKQ